MSTTYIFSFVVFSSIHQIDAFLFIVELLQMVEILPKTTPSRYVDYVQLEDWDCLVVKG